MELKKIQGNVIGFNKRHQHFFFLHFHGPTDETTAWLHRIADAVTSVDEVLHYRADRRHNRRTVDKPWLNLAFTYAGLETLNGRPLTGFPQEFVDGMAKRADRLGDTGDNAPGKWVYPQEEKEEQEPVHALLILAANDEDTGGFDQLMEALGASLVDDEINASAFDRLVKSIGASLVKFGINVLYEQRGQDRGGNDAGREHFGFKDGISQPALNNPDVLEILPKKPGQELIHPGEFVLGYRRQDPSARADDEEAFLAPITPSPEWTRDGSYLVFRRLHQKVKAFETFVATQAKRLELSEDMLRAKLVGRYRSGAPLAALKPGEIAEYERDNISDPGEADATLLEAPRAYDFRYAKDDEAGRHVPRGAHIRRLNPRDQESPGLPFARTKRILRCGLPYGREEDADRGLLFICYQSSIADQFEFLQRSWANDSYFPPTGADSIRPGRDPFAVKGPEARQFHLPGENDASRRVTLSRWVTMTGGGYFFSPSRDKIHALADEDILTPDERKQAEADLDQTKAEWARTAAIEFKRELAEPKRKQADTEEFERRLMDTRAAIDNDVDVQTELEKARRELQTAQGALEAAEHELAEAQKTERRWAAAIGNAPKLAPVEIELEAAEVELEAAKVRLAGVQQAMARSATDNQGGEEAAEHELPEAQEAVNVAEHELVIAQKAVKVSQVKQRRALGLGADLLPTPPLPNTIRGGGDCKVQITVAFNGLDPDFYYPWRVWVGDEPVWASQRSEYLAAGGDGFATGTMWMRTPRLVEALDPDLTAGEIIESGWRDEPPGNVLGAYLKWEVEVIIRTEAPGGGVKALRKGSASSVGSARWVATVWPDERIGEFFPIDMGLWPA